MGKLYQRYKRNGRQVGKFTEANYKEVEQTKSEDSVSTQAINNQLQLESVAKREEPQVDTQTNNDQKVESSINEELNNPTFDLPKEFRQHLSEYISSQNIDSNNQIPKPQPAPPQPQTTPVVAESNPPAKEQYEIEASELGFTNLPKNLAHALISWKKSGRPVVESHQWEERISICRSCSYWTENQQTNYAKCTKCGCGSGKLLLSSSHCPLSPPKW